MRYTVRWSRTAEDELTRLWLQAADRAVVTAAAEAIDKRLAVNPEAEGESRDNGLRILFETPLASTYEVDRRTREVRVAHVWRFRVG